MPGWVRGNHRCSPSTVIRLTGLAVVAPAPEFHDFLTGANRVTEGSAVSAVLLLTAIVRHAQLGDQCVSTTIQGGVCPTRVLRATSNSSVRTDGLAMSNPVAVLSQFDPRMSGISTS